MLAALTSGAVAQQQLNDAQLRALIPGKAVSFSDGITAEYHPDGRYTVKTSAGIEKGKWTIGADQLCVDFDNGKRRCDRLYSDAEGYYLTNARGGRFRASYAPIGSTPVATGTTQTICEQAVEYHLYPIPREAPENVRAFVGLWIGKLEWGNCSALIVEAVQPNGTANGIYMAGSWQGFKANQSRIAATIVANKLSWGAGTSVSFEYVMSNPTQLSMTRTGTGADVRGQLSRQR
jgi:hypothetical protein